jgi:hypothetical protein
VRAARTNRIHQHFSIKLISQVLPNSVVGTEDWCKYGIRPYVVYFALMVSEAGIEPARRGFWSQRLELNQLTNH